MSSTTAVTKTVKKLLGNRFFLSIFSRERHLWTSDNIVKSPFKDLIIPKRTIPQHIWENLDKWADKTAIVCGVTQQSYTYHQLYKYSRNFAAKLRSVLKIRDGDVVCIMMPNSPDYAVSFYGILEAGAIVTTINPIYTAHEVHRQLQLSNPKAIICVPETINVIKESFKLAKVDIPLITCKNNQENHPAGTISFQEFALDFNTDHSILNEVNIKMDDVALLPYSSGTTGLPKGVELTHYNIVANCVQQDLDGFNYYNDTTSTNQDATLAVLPLYHIYALSMVMVQKQSVGLKVVTLPKFQPERFLTALTDHKINLLCAAPPIVLFLGSYPGVKKEHLESLKTMTCGAAPVPHTDIIKVLEKHRMDFLQMYGMTEASPLVSAMLPGSNEYTTAGVAIPNTELKVVDSNLQSLGPEEAGELLIRGPQIMKGYRNNVEATKQAITKDGWYRSGDLVKISEDGIVTVADRLKELIKVKGYQVPPAELEGILKELPEVLDAAVIGVPDARQGEIPKAFVVVKEGCKLETQSILKFVADRVAEYKRIKEVMVLDELPKNPSGKILKRVLKEKFGNVSA